MVWNIGLKMQSKQIENLSALAAKAKDDPAAFGGLYDHYVQPVFQYLYRRVDTMQDAEDLTSQTFIEAFESMQRYRERGHFAAWLFGIARHKLMDYYRRKTSRLPLAEAEKLVVERDTLGQMIQQDEELSRLQSLIRTLRDDEQDLIYLRYLAGLSYVEMAELLGKNVDAVKKSVYRLLARLKSQME